MDGDQNVVLYGDEGIVVILIVVIDSEKVFSRCRSQRLMEWLKGNQNAKEIPENLSFRFQEFKYWQAARV